MGRDNKKRKADRRAKRKEERVKSSSPECSRDLSLVDLTGEIEFDGTLEIGSTIRVQNHNPHIPHLRFGDRCVVQRTDSKYLGRVVFSNRNGYGIKIEEYK